MPPRGRSDADVSLRIRAIDEGGLRLFRMYRAEIARLKRDLRDMRSAGKMRDDSRPLVREASSRVAAREQQRLQAEENRRRAASEKAQRAGEQRIARARIAAIREDKTRQREIEAGLKREQSSVVANATARQRFQTTYRRAEREGYAEQSRLQVRANAQNAASQQARLGFTARVRRAEQQAYAEDVRRNRTLAASRRPPVGNLRGLQEEDALWKKLRNSVIAYYAARQTGRALLGFVREGLKFNQILETATLGIASVITASGELQDAQGKNVQGAAALTGAYKLAGDQVRQLRIAGLQTAATTEQLVEAFQQAVGPGLAAGLNLDEIRRITIQIVQAAGAIGVPFHQLNQEVRSILDATIDRNSRVARVLQLTNKEVKLAREQGKLATVLADRFQAFSVAGAEAAKTMAVIKSNVFETFQVFAGTATEGLFTKLRDGLGKAVIGVFDFDKAQISQQFQGLLQSLQTVFGSIGGLLAGAIAAAVRGAESLSDWLRANRVEISIIVDRGQEVARAFGRIIVDSVLFLGHLVGAKTQSGGIAGLLDTVAQTLGFINRHGQVLLTLFIGIKLAALAMSTSFIAFLTATQRHPIIFTLTAIGVSIGAILTLLNKANAEQEALLRRQRQLVQDRADLAPKQIGLVKEYAAISEQLEKTKRGTDEYNRLQERLGKTTRDLIDISPKFLALLSDERNSRQDVIDAMVITVSRQRRVIEGQHLEAQATLDLAKARVKMARADLGARFFNLFGVTAPIVRNAKEAQEQAQAAVDALAATLKEFDRIAEAPVDTGVTPFRRFKPAAEDDSKAAKARSDAKQLANAELETRRQLFQRERAELDKQLEFEEITREKFNADVVAGIKQRVVDEIAILDRLRPKIAADAKERQLLDEEQKQVRLQGEEEILDFQRQASREARRQRQQDIQESKKETEQALAEATARINAESQSINERIFRGEITKSQGAAIFKQALQEEIDKAIELRDALMQVGSIQGTPELEMMLVRIGNLVTGLQKKVLTADQTLGLLRASIKESLVDGMTDAAVDFITNTENMADAVRNMARSIIADIARILIRMAAMEAVTALFGAIGGGGGGGQLSIGSFGGVAPDFAKPGMATGGFVSGPGTGTSDSIPARLSAGEYVINARKVREIGEEALDAINFGARGARTRKRGFYATGGIVETGGALPGGSATVTIGLEDGLIVRTLESSAGVNVVTKILRNNPRRIKQALGAR